MMSRLTATVWLVAVLAAGTAAMQPASGSQAAGQQPVFRAKTELVTVDMVAVDNDGRPVRDLGPTEFTLEVDGKPRRISSVEYIGGRGTEGVPHDPRRPTAFSSNEPAGLGRLIMIAVDEGNMRFGGGRVGMQSAQKFVDRLEPADRVGLSILPQGRQIPFTANHAIVREALMKVVGRSDASRQRSSYNIGLTEALALDRGNTFLWDEAVARECLGADRSCPLVMKEDARTMVSAMQQQAIASLEALRSLITQLGQIEGPKTLVLVSEGITDDRDLSDFSWVPAMTAAARVSIYVLQLDSSGVDLARSRPSPSEFADQRMLSAGLERISGMARGALFRVTASADFAFDRIVGELSGYYLLSFEPEGADRDGAAHKIKVGTRRPGVTLRTRREFVVTEAPRTTRTVDERLGDLLRAPFPATDLLLKVNAYTIRATKPDEVRVLVTSEIDPGAAPLTSVELAFMLVDAQGKVARDSLQRVTLGAEVLSGTGSHTFVTPIVVSPGAYTVKLAVVGDDGRAGSIEHPVTARLTDAGRLQMSDLIFTEEGPQTGGPRKPAVRLGEDVDIVGAYVELYGKNGGDLQDTDVRFEIARRDVDAAIVSAPGRLGPIDGARRSALMLVRVGALEPGDYVARALVIIKGKESGRATHVFNIPPRAVRVPRPSQPPGSPN